MSSGDNLNPTSRFIFMLFCISSIQSAPLSSYLVSSSPDLPVLFNHVAINNATGDIYIGARETLYQLNSYLSIKNTVVLGQCPSPDGANTNNNKLLVVAPLPEDKLITCGGCDGFCETRSLINISNDVVRHDSIDIQIVVNTENVPTVGVVDLGAEHYWYGSGVADNELYLFTGVSHASSAIGPILKHNLADLSYTQRVSAQESYITPVFRHLISYNEYIFYFMNRNDIVYLGRLCRNSLDRDLASYTEIELQCGSYNMIQSAHIGPAGFELAGSLGIDMTEDIIYAVLSSESSSGLCVYKMSDVQQSFEDAVLGCIIIGNNAGAPNSYLEGSECNRLNSFTPDDQYQCTAYYEGAGAIYRYPIGTSNLTSSPILTIPDVTPTSIVTTIERSHTVSFMGDTVGQLHKVHIVNGSFGYVYETISLGSGSVLQEMFLDESKELLTLARSSEQSSQVLKLNLANCGQFETCDECIGTDGGNDGNPFCGWCTLEAKCTRYNDCPFPDESTRWLSYNALQCVEISGIQPDNKLPYHKAEQEINITIDQLPDLAVGEGYQCEFDTFKSLATVISLNTVTCTTPTASQIPQIPDGEYEVRMSLSIVSTETEVSFVTNDFIFFDCSNIKLCSSCATSPYPCNWCVYENRCTDESSSCQTVVIGDNNPYGSGNRGQEYCPQLLGTTEEFLIPVAVNFGYSLSARNLPTEQGVTFECILHIEGEDERVPSAFFNETFILCNGRQYTYDENVLQMNARVSVQWNGQNNLDEPSETDVTLYKCSVNGGSCSRCLSPAVTPSILNCGWCGTDCNVRESQVCQNSAQFLNQSETDLCSAPVIEDFHPLSGPVGGSSRLDIRGTDIGLEFDDVLRILIGDLDCELTEDMRMYYQPGQSVSCMTSVSTEPRSDRIQIIVMSGDSYKTGQSQDEFQYRIPVIEGFNPVEGPAAGGTRITISGTHLKTGRNIRARFGDAECEDISVHESVATCTSTSIQENEQIFVRLTVTFDGVEKTFDDYSFTYQPNPIITEIDRTTAIMSGGTDIMLTGERFHLIQEKWVVVVSLTSDASNYELCNGTETTLICPIPPFPGNPAKRRRTTADIMTANLTFDFDGHVIDWGLIEYFPDPVYNSFRDPERIYYSSNGRLDITGMNINLASTVDDVQVFLGPDGICDVDLLEAHILRCALPENPPQAGDINGTKELGATRNLPAVVHGNLRFYPGYISAWPTGGPSDLVIIITVILVLIVVLGVPFIFVTRWFMKKQRHLKQAREEVEMVRSNILKRVQEVGSTSLDVSEADERVRNHGIPFRGHVNYVTMMLFGGLGVHPETSDPEYMEEFMELSVISFYRMLKKKEVLTEFISQLETKKQGHGRERELIASLLAITFVSEGKSIHFTEVLMSLVEEKIRAASRSRRSMDTLFTNTESIADKLISNWFALFMFDYLKVFAMYPLYMLYQAIKTQAEKGPIDVATGEAYFTLDYNTLFDQSIEFRCLDLYVVDEDGQVYLQVCVLDVDSVKQVTQKILDAVWKKGYCLLPRDVEAVDLVWIQTDETSLLLHDTSYSEGKILVNTIKSYGIQSGCRVALIPKQHGKTDSYQALNLKDVSANTYESLLAVSSESANEPDVSQHTSTTVHLKEGDDPTRGSSAMPDYIKKRQSTMHRNLAIPHMLIMKASISPYVDGIFEVMFKKPDRMPLPVKRLFDKIDEVAVMYCQGGDEGLAGDYADKWKRNCLSNFWCAVLANLPSLFEMPRSETADRCVVVLSDAVEHAARKVSLRQDESDHLPYYKEHPLQRRMMKDYCTEVARLPKVRPSKLNRACATTSKEFKGEFSHLSSMLHLYNLTKNDVENLLKESSNEA